MFVCILLRESASYETRNGTVRPGLKGRGGGAGGGQGRRGGREQEHACAVNAERDWGERVLVLWGIRGWGGEENKYV